MRNNIITLQELFAGRNEEFDIAVQKNRVKLVRHKDNRSDIIIKGVCYDKMLFEIYKHNRQAFLDYQGQQSKSRFDGIDFIVSFLGENSRDARFIGVYKNNGKSDGYTSEDSTYFYDFSEVSGFDSLKEKVIIDWGKGAITWHQYYSNVKEVVRIEKGIEDADGLPYFKSYNDINLTFEQLKSIIEKEPEEWKIALQSVNCIYMIVDSHSGKQYIGSTYSKNDKKSGGIWHRWSNYVKTGGHAGNLDLERVLSESGEQYVYNFRWIVLETMPLHITDKEAIARENINKEKFLTREFGYNKN